MKATNSNQLLLKFLLKKRNRKRMSKEIHFEQVSQGSPILEKPAEELLSKRSEIRMEDFFSRNGNVSPHELMILAALVKEHDPKSLLEIGTFDGNTTFQLALNVSEEAVIHTIDLPHDDVGTAKPVLEGDLKFIQDEKKLVRKFEGTGVAGKIKQHFGDSTSYDFSKFEGPLDFIFVDGGHSYDCVKSDTENALKHLSENGCILWHDFTPHFGDVFRFLCELSQTLPLVHIEGTNLVIYTQMNSKDGNLARRRLEF